MTSLIRPRAVGGSRLVIDYLNQVPSALPFYAGSPFRLESYRAKLAELDARFGHAERTAAASTLLPTSANARERLERFVRDGGIVVTTGQQTGFLTGPLYTIYKAISAAALARHLEEKLGRVVIPVFWIASEDHDWEEVNHVHLLDPGGRLRRFTLPSEDLRPLPMSQRRLEGDLFGVAEEIIQYIGQPTHSDDLVRRILDPFTVPGATISEAFRASITAVLGPFDILLADASNPMLKELSKPVLREALQAAQAHAAAIARRSREVEEAGYPTQVNVVEGATNVFRHDERGRERLFWTADGYTVRERRGRWNGVEVLDELDATPGSFSPNVLLRPVVESAIYPTIAYVGGPGEIAYLGQVGAIFEEYGRMPPIAVPRFSGMVMEAGVERALGELRLSVSDLNESKELLIDRLARRELPADAMQTLASTREDIVIGFDRLTEQVEELDPTLIGSLGSIRNRLLIDSRRAERKILRAIKRGDRVAVARLDRVLDSLRPAGLPQDRVLNILPFLARYGLDFLNETRRAIDEHWRLPDEP